MKDTTIATTPEPTSTDHLGLVEADDGFSLRAD